MYHMYYDHIMSYVYLNIIYFYESEKSKLKIP